MSKLGKAGIGRKEKTKQRKDSPEATRKILYFWKLVNLFFKFPKIKIAIADEAHYLKNRAAKRSK